MLSGILFSVAAVSRLMEITIILIYPSSIFLLRQAANSIIVSIIRIAPIIIIFQPFSPYLYFCFIWFIFLKVYIFIVLKE